MSVQQLVARWRGQAEASGRAGMLTTVLVLRRCADELAQLVQDGGAKRSKAFPATTGRCAYCGAAFTVQRRHGSARRFCSARCRRRAWAARRER